MAIPVWTATVGGPWRMTRAGIERALFGRGDAAVLNLPGGHLGRLISAEREDGGGRSFNLTIDVEWAWSEAIGRPAARRITRCVRIGDDDEPREVFVIGLGASAFLGADGTPTADRDKVRTFETTHEALTALRDVSGPACLLKGQFLAGRLIADTPLAR